MHHQQPSNPKGCFVTQEQLLEFKQAVMRQIQQLSSGSKSQSANMGHIPSLPTQLSSDEQEFQAQIKQMRTQIEALKARIVKLEQCIQKRENTKGKGLMGESFDSLILANQKVNEEEGQNISQSFKLMQYSSSSFQIQQEEQNIQAMEGSGHKCQIENRKTNQGTFQGQNQEDDEELIQCVWDSNPSIKQTILNNENHHHNPHQGQFIVNHYNQFINITKVKGQGLLSSSHNFIYKQSIPADKVTSYRVKRIRVKDAFFIGIGSIYIFGVQNAFRHLDSLAYSSNGDVWTNCDARKCGDAVSNGGSIEMVVDRIRGEVSWLTNGILMYRHIIPYRMARNQLYLNIMLFNKDDNVHLYCGD